jgi:hypothetical protein
LPLGCAINTATCCCSMRPCCNMSGAPSQHLQLNEGPRAERVSSLWPLYHPCV